METLCSQRRAHRFVCLALFGAYSPSGISGTPSTPLGQVTPLGIGLFLDRGYSYFCKVTPCLAFLTVEGEGEEEG